MDGAAIYRTEAEIGFLPLKNRPRKSGITYSPIRGLAFQVAQDNNNNNIKMKEIIIIRHFASIEGDNLIFFYSKLCTKYTFKMKG